MTRSAFFGLLLLGLTSLLSACASQGLTDESSSQSSTEPVPGEKTGEGAVQPGVGPGGAGANVRF